MVTTADHSADHFCVELQLQRARSVCHTRIIKRPATSNYARFVPTTISFSVYARDNRVSTPINVPRNSRARDKYWRKETQICRSDSRALPDETRAVYMLFFFVFFSFFFWKFLQVEGIREFKSLLCPRAQIKKDIPSVNKERKEKNEKKIEREDARYFTRWTRYIKFYPMTNYTQHFITNGTCDYLIGRERAKRGLKIFIFTIFDTRHTPLDIVRADMF